MENLPHLKPHDTYWQNLAVMVLLAAALFGSIEFIPAVVGGPAGSILAVIVGGVFLYLFGRQTGCLMAESNESA